MKAWQWMTALALCVAGCRQATTMCPAGQIYSEEFRVCAGDCTDRNNENCWSRDGGFVPGRDGAADVVGDDGVADVASDVVIADVRDDRPDVIADVPDDVPSEDPSIEAPRPTFPCSLCDTTTRRPTFRWELPAMVSGAVLELCRDRACTMPIETVRVTAASAQPTMDLPASSVVFWRLRGTRGVTAGTRTSATWLLHTPAVSAPHATAGLPHVDVNGDGFDDIVLGAANATVGGQAQTGEVRVFHGGPGGPTVTPNTVLQGRVSGGRFGIFVANVGDVNGDGFGEVVVLSTTTSNVFVFGGSSSGLGMDPLFTLDPMLRAGSSPNAAAGGDFNGDGYSDIVISWSRAPLTMGSVVFVGAGRSTPTISPVGGVMVVSSQLFSLGDVDGDELADVGSWSRHVAFGHRSTVLVSTEIAGLGSMVSASGGDANGDGYFDAFVSDGFFNPRIALGGSAFARSRTEVTVRMPASWLGVIAVLGARDVDDDGRSELVMLGDVGSGMRELSVLLGSSGAFADVASDRIRDTGSGRSSGGLLVNLAGRQRGAVLCDPTRTAGMLDFAGGCRAFTVVNAGVRSPAIWAVDGTRAGEELGNSTAQ